MLFFALCQVVGESGLFTPDHISFVQNAGVKAVSDQPMRHLLTGRTLYRQLAHPVFFGADTAMHCHRFLSGSPSSSRRIQGKQSLGFSVKTSRLMTWKSRPNRREILDRIILYRGKMDQSTLLESLVS
jgi:hypothetical protein